MKIKGILLAALSLVGITGAFAQAVESDDMYFTSEDRAKLKAQKTTEVAYSYNAPSKSKKLDFKEEPETGNPTDSYSARQVNPEYTSRAHTQTAQADEEDYFVNNYQYNKNQYNNWNDDFNNWYSSPLYRSNYYGAAINNFNSPYYGYNRYSSPWYDPYWSYNGYSSAFSFQYGSAWNYGWGGNYNYWNRPYYGWDPYYSSIGYYGGGYWNNCMYPSTIIVANSDRGNALYRKRPTRGTTVVSQGEPLRSRSNVYATPRSQSSGRMATQSTRQEDYYSRYNRTRSTSNSTYDNRSNTQYNRSRSWDNSSWNSGGSDRSGRTSAPSYTPSRSSSSGSSGGARTNTGGSSSGGRGRD